MAVDTVPDGYPTIPIIATDLRDELYNFLKEVFEVELVDRYESPSGPVFMSIRIGDSVISVMQPIDGQQTRSAFYVYVRDVDDAYQHAIQAGAKSIQEPTKTVHGDLMGTVIDPFGNQWTIASRIEQISIIELHRRLKNVEAK